MRTALHSALILGAACAFSAGGAELIKPVLDIRDMRVVVAYLSNGAFVDLQAKHGLGNRRELRPDYRQGFSILKSNKETGARTCEIYLPEAKRPRKVDDDATLVLGHELLHCMLGDYHR